MNKITLLLILVTQFSFAQSMSQFTVSDVYENHTLCGSPGASLIIIMILKPTL